MSLFYKIELKDFFTIDEIDSLLMQVNNALNTLASIHDFNIENYEIDQPIIEEGSDASLWVDLSGKFDYLSGYLTLLPTDSKDKSLRVFKKIAIKTLSLSSIVVAGVYIQDGQMLMEKKLG